MAAFYGSVVVVGILYYYLALHRRGEQHGPRLVLHLPPDRIVHPRLAAGTGRHAGHARAGRCPSSCGRTRPVLSRPTLWTSSSVSCRPSSSSPLSPISSRGRGKRHHDAARGRPTRSSRAPSPRSGRRRSSGGGRRARGRVEERTAQLYQANLQLAGEMEERMRSEEALRASEGKLNAIRFAPSATAWS